MEEAIGGVLFIDEAYSLTQNASAQGDYGGEVIQTLLKRMEDQRGLFFVFVAGYTEPMELFLKSNPGLNSRFDRILKFEDYNPQELMDISIKMFADQNFTLHHLAQGQLLNYLEYIYATQDKCYMVEPTNIDEDKDGVDGSCDGFIAKAPVVDPDPGGDTSGGPKDSPGCDATPSVPSVFLTFKNILRSVIQNIVHVVKSVVRVVSHKIIMTKTNIRKLFLRR